MGQILKFPTRKIEPLTIRSGSKHRIDVEVLDQMRPRRTRWYVQFEIQDIAGYRALDGFTDAAVAAGYRHRFSVTSTKSLRQFVAETADLVAAGKLAIWIDGVRVRARIERRA